MDDFPRITIEFTIKGADPNNPPMPLTCGVCCRTWSEHTPEMKAECNRKALEQGEE